MQELCVLLAGFNYVDTADSPLDDRPCPAIVANADKLRRSVEKRVNRGEHGR